MIESIRLETCQYTEARTAFARRHRTREERKNVFRSTMEIGLCSTVRLGIDVFFSGRVLRACSTVRASSTSLPFGLQPLSGGPHDLLQFHDRASAQRAPAPEHR